MCAIPAAIPMTHLLFVVAFHSRGCLFSDSRASMSFMLPCGMTGVMMTGPRSERPAGGEKVKPIRRRVAG
jgi:hypothetical protein